MSLENIKYSLQRNSVQRVVYAALLMVWVSLWITNRAFLQLERLTGIEDYWVLLIPSLILIAQVILNNKSLWKVVGGLISAYSIWVVWNILFLNILLNYHRDYVPNDIWTPRNIISLLIPILLLFVVNWIIWKLNPTKVR